ncbi:unnamed protein product [Callosobruchus maculatus]|uniref:Uncharacterized protein n=1 Tax=Callosobruchus maculatus TaxID=64391 RepID=A0A653DHA7_CALMS|nr:unnamed protein product [Callosobruchus maculatus]
MIKMGFLDMNNSYFFMVEVLSSASQLKRKSHRNTNILHYINVSNIFQNLQAAGHNRWVKLLEI